METSILIKKIDSLPEIFKAEIEDFVDFLIQKYATEQESNFDKNLTETQKQEILQRHKKMRDNPGNSMSIEEFKQQILGKYASK